MPTSRIRKLLSTIFAFVSLCVSAQAANYWWIGGTTGSWNDPTKWANTEDGTAGTGYPGDTPAVTNDEVHIYGEVEVTIASNISIGKLLIQSGTNSLTSNFTTTLSGTGSLTVTDNSDAAINITRCSGTDGVIGTLTINLPVTCSGTIQTHSGTTLNIASGKSLETVNLVHSAYGDSPKTELQVNGTLTVTDTLNLNAMGSGATQLIVSSGGLVDAKNITFGSATYSNTGAASAIVNNGIIKVSNAFTIPDLSLSPYTGSGTIKLDGSGTGASFTNNYTSGNITIEEIQGLQTATVSGGGHTSITTATFSAGATISDASITTAEFTGAADISGSTITNATFHDDINLSGENTFQNLTATGLGGKTLTVNAEQTFQSGGTVTLSGTGDSNLLTVTGNGSGKFILCTTTLTGEYLSLNTDSSVVSASTGTAFAQNSETTGSGTTSWIVTSAGGHLWNGENGNWETATNWLPQALPATTDEVIINSGTPKINSAVTVKSITVNGGGINLSTGSLTIEAINFSLANATSVTAAASTTINITGDQEIDEKITGPGKLVLASGKNYTIPPSTTIRINIENNGTLASTGTVSFSGDFTNTGSATFTGGLSIAGDLEDTGSLTGAITFNGTGDQTFSPNNVIYSGITVDKSAGSLSVDSSLQVTTLTLTSGAVSINGNLTLWNGTVYQNYDFSSLTNTLTFTGGSSASPRVLRAAAIINSSKISADYLKLQAQGSSDITLNSCQNISNLTLETSGNISVNGITADSLSIDSGAASVKMKDTITLNSTSQDFIINYPLLLTGDTTFSLGKDIIVQDTDGSIKSDTSSGKNLSLTANTIKLLNGNALGDSTTGALGTVSINSNLTLEADTQFFSSQINFAGTGAKSLSGAYTLSASGNVSDTGAWTWAAGSTLLFNGSADQTFKTNTNSTYKDITVNKTTRNFIIDTSVLKADNLTITDCEEIHFTGANEITTIANLSFPKPVTADNNLTISNTSGNVSFTNTFTSSGNLNIPDVSVTFGGNVTATAISTKATTINCSKIQSSGNQNYTGAVTLGANTELESSSGNISFTSTVDGANTLKLTSSAGTSFGGNVGASTSLTSLEVNGTSNINCTSITTSGNQTYNNAVNLADGGTTAITGANVTFNNTVNGNNSLTVTSSGDGKVAAFNGNVGATTSKELTSITVNGNTKTCDTLHVSIITSGNQTYNGTVTLNKSTTFSARTTDASSVNQTVEFKQNVTGSDTNTILTCNADLKVEDITISIGKEIDFSGNISGSNKTLTINTPTFKSTATSNNSITVNKLVFAASETSLQSASAELNFTASLIDGNGEIKLETSGSKISFTNDVTLNPKVTTATGTTFIASSGNMTFNSHINLANNTLSENSGTIILAGTNTTLSGGNSFNNLIIKSSVTIAGSNTITNLTAGDEATGLGDKTITFAAASTQTVNGTLKLNGSSETSRLILRSSTAESPWNILCQGTNAHSIHFVDISDSNNQSSYNLFAITSNDSGNNTKWNFPGMIYTWNGNSDNSWNTAANWTPASIPGKGADVKIASVTSPASTLLLSSDLDLTDSYNGTDYNGTITVNAGAVFDLAGNNLSVGTITNNGLVRLTGASTQTITAAMNNGAASTVEYYGAGAATSNFAWDGDNGSGSAGRQYVNLIISRAISQNTDAADKLQVAGTTTIIAGSTNSVSLNNPYNIFNGHVILGNHSTSISAGTVTLNGTGAGSVAIFLEENIFADNLTLNSNVRGDTLTFLTPLTVNTAQVSSTGAQIYNSPVSITHNANFVSGSGTLINFADTITGNGTASLTISTADSKFEGIVSNLSSLTTDANTTINANLTIDSLFTQTASLNCTAITTSGNQNYHGAVTLGNSSLLTLTADNITFDSTIDGAHPITFSTPDNPEKTISVAGIIGQTATPAIKITQAGTVNFTNLVKSSSFEITKANSTTFNDTVEINTFTDTSDAGNISFKNGGTISNPTGTEFLTTGTITFGDSSEDSILFGTTSTYANLTHTAGNTLIAGTLNANNITFTDAVLTDDTSIISQGTQNFTGTINDSTAGSHQLILNSNNSQITFTQNIGETTAPRLLTVNGPSAINCQLVKTTESQTYNNAITGDDSISLESAVINLNCSTITTNGSQTFNGPTLLQSNTTLISDTGDLHFTSTVNGSHKLTLAKANISTFDNTVEVTDFEITQAAATNFEATATIGSFSDTATAGNISFKNGGTISSSTGTTFLTSGTVTLGNGADNTFNFGNSEPYANLTHTAGITNINGVINAACITLGETTGGQITLNNTDLFKTTDGSPLNYSTSFTQIGTANSILGGSFTGNGNASFTTNVLLFGSSPADFGSADNNISINKNLIISRSAELTINATLAIPNNLVIYNGDITTNADVSAGDDILLLGNAYSAKDDTTGIEDEFFYTTPRHNNWSQPNYTATELPDGSTLPTDYSGTLSVAAGKTILAGKNFYVNGSSMSLAEGSGQWNLSLADISDPSKAFAEAYYTSISGCKVILHSSDSNVSDSAKEDGSYARLAALECTDNGTTTSPNQNIEFEDFMITNAFTVRDNAIRVEFNQPIRYHTTTIGSLNFHDSSDSPEPDFTGFYSDPDCTPEHELKSDIQLSYLNPDDNKTYYYFYIKAAPQDSAPTGAWNTDATGKSIGAENEKSSDRDGIHHATFPCLDFPRSLKKEDGSTLSFIITDRWGKRLNNYSKRPSTTATEPAYGALTSSKEVTDKTGPVLWSVRTGQELHTAYNPAAGAASQHSYDSHNFLEFRYSEPVEFYEQNNLRTITENFQVTDELGAIAEDITSELNTITFAGLAKLNAASGTSLKLHTGIQGTASKYTNALYRTDEYSVRISIAGWTDGTVTDYSGNIYKKWPGYIETASQFTNATAIAFTDNNSSIKDLNQNNQIEYAAGCRKEPVVLSDSSGNHTANLIPTSPDLYSKWDLSEPYFTPLRNSVTSTITASDNDWSKTNERSEAIGNTNGTGSTLDRIDFHFFDNTPNFDDTDEAEWFTEVGWCLPGTSSSKSNLKDSSYTYAADIIGGARQFDTIASRRTSGGIRFSSKLFAAPGFKYSTDQDAVPETPFATGLENVHSTVVSQLFTGSSEPRHAANDPDGLYLGLGITDTALPVETTFAFSYNESAAYLTDLAGNRLRSKTSKTIDRTPPSFDIILSPVNQNQIYIVFVKQIVTSGEGIRICDADGNPQTVENNLLTLLPDCFQLVRISEDGTYTATDENDITIDSSVPANIIEQYSDNHFTCICLRTTRNITFDDVRNLHIQLKNHKAWPEKSQDPFTSNKNARVTFIQDGSGNYMPMYSAHALSDFAINYVNPLYAYSSDITEDENPVMDGLYENGSWAVHNWNADQNKYGTLPSDHSAAIVTALEDNSENATTPDIRIYLSDSPDRDSVSKQFNKDFKTSLRVWLPELSDGIFRALTATNNSNFSFVDSELLTQNNQSSQNELDSSNNLIFNIPLEMIQKWKSGDQISFVFGITNTDGSPVRIYNNPYFDIENNRYDFSHNIPVPLYSLRMHDTTDIGTLDLWSFRLKGITGQRGGVTILNNVINAANGEKTVIKVDVPVEGKLNVIVMTLDGNIITYLHRGNAKAGENYFTWDGKNRSGSAVARGMYFIRVVGTDFDETRKVMVVK